METLAETAGETAAHRQLRPLVVVTVAALCVVKGELLALLLPAPGTARGESSWELPECAPDGGAGLEDTARQAVSRWLPPAAAYVEQLHTWHEAGADRPEARLEVAYLALCPPQSRPLSPRSPSGEVGWYPMQPLPALRPIHARILETARARLRERLGHTNLAARLLPLEFSLSELQQVYEAVQGRELDKRNFRKWVLGSELVEATPRHRRDGAHRPARLYRFVTRELTTLG
ncbi:MAG: hydrolase [Armatimonadetes bacterium]|nr:hydrolase [Armatimonadota bacterium]